MNTRVLLAALVIVVPPPGSLLSQDAPGSASDLMTRAIRAYQDLEFDVAATLLRRALSSTLDDTTRVRALTYLGAADQYRGRRDSAEAVFRRLIVLSPTYRPDTLVFPPEITRLYDYVHSKTPVVAVAVRPPPPPPADTVPQPPPRTVPTAPVVSERPHGITATGAAQVVNVHANSAGGLPPASGTVLGVSGSVRVDRFELDLRYLEGSLDTRDLVEGAAAVRFATTSWLTLQSGPQIRRYSMPAGAERWVTWQLGARAETPILNSIVHGHAMLWQGLGLSVNVPPGSGSSRGGELGVTLAVPNGPFWFGLAYRFDKAALNNSSRRESVNALTLTGGVRRLP